MKTRLISMLLVLCMVLALVPCVSAADELTQEQVYNSMMALQSQYPEGTPWTNANFYNWNGGIYSGGGGCAGFAFMLSDAAFGTLKARKIENITISDVRPGDILRMNSDSHSVIVLEVYDSYVVVAEGNYNSSVHWGRTISAQRVAESDYMLTRYPEETGQTPSTPSETPNTPNTPNDSETGCEYGPFCASNDFLDMPPVTDWSHAGIDFVYFYGIMNGNGNGTFAPEADLSRAMLAQILYNWEDRPEVSYSGVFTDVSQKDWYASAVEWAYQEQIILGVGSGKFDPETPVSREQLATILFRYAQRWGIDTTNRADLTQFPDSNTVGQWYGEAMEWAVAEGIINGSTDYGVTRLLPQKGASRAVVAALMMRFIERYIFS